jgi:hypothetical protein
LDKCRESTVACDLNPVENELASLDKVETII